ncbi:MAG: DivIVA domain-containing protein [Oscillospiraceae bacterium]|nr:DivIVA domain-containing protein [Oscillospiraceae bacterium]
MMTPNDVENRQFNNVRFGGYNTEDVNRFLDSVATDYSALYKENATLKRKMKFLVVKLNELQVAEAKAMEEKKKEDIVHQAYLNAREAAEKMIASARAERDAMIAEAKLEADRIRYDAQQSVVDAEERMEAARKSTLEFASGMRMLVDQQKGCLERKAKEMTALLAQEQHILETQMEFLSRLDQLRAVEEEAEELLASPEPVVERDMTQILDETLAAELRAVEEEAAANPAAAYEQDMSDVEAVASEFVDEPTRVIDISSAMDQDYQF